MASSKLNVIPIERGLQLRNQTCRDCASFVLGAPLGFKSSQPVCGTTGALGVCFGEAALPAPWPVVRGGFRCLHFETEEQATVRIAKRFGLCPGCGEAAHSESCATAARRR